MRIIVLWQQWKQSGSGARRDSSRDSNRRLRKRQLKQHVLLSKNREGLWGVHKPNHKREGQLPAHAQIAMLLQGHLGGQRLLRELPAHLLQKRKAVGWRGLGRKYVLFSLLAEWLRREREARFHVIRAHGVQHQQLLA